MKNVPRLPIWCLSIYFWLYHTHAFWDQGLLSSSGRSLKLHSKQKCACKFHKMLNAVTMENTWLLRSLYGLKQSNYNFYKKLSTALQSRNSMQCSNDNCMHVSKILILVACVDEVLIFSKKKVWIDMLIKYLFNGEENFELTDEGNVDKNIGVDMRKHNDGTCELR